MQRYGIIKDGSGFIVQADEQSVLKCTSRRKAAKTISDANDLLRADTSSVSQESPTEPVIVDA
jgi:hypothetical protein